MLGGNGFSCGPCPKCGENDFWNESRCMSCGYEQESDEEDGEKKGKDYVSFLRFYK